MVDPFGRSFATGIACIALPENEIRYFVGCEANLECFLFFERNLGNTVIARIKKGKSRENKY